MPFASVAHLEYNYTNAIHLRNTFRNLIKKWIYVQMACGYVNACFLRTTSQRFVVLSACNMHPYDNINCQQLMWQKAKMHPSCLGFSAIVLLGAALVVVWYWFLWWAAHFLGSTYAWEMEVYWCRWVLNAWVPVEVLLHFHLHLNNNCYGSPQQLWEPSIISFRNYEIHAIIHLESRRCVSLLLAPRHLFH